MKIRNPFLIGLAGSLTGIALWGLFRTLRFQLTTTENANPYASKSVDRFLFSVWHDSSVIAAFGGRHEQTVALTSRHRDGAFVAAVIRVAGVGTVRGSTGVSGGRAMRTMIRIAGHQDIVLAPDGPRGPNRRMSKGIVFLASKTGSSIIPTAFACSRYWRIRGTWTSLVIPVPFSRVILLAGAPIHIPDGITQQEIEHYVGVVQLAMDQLDAKAEQLNKRKVAGKRLGK